MQQTVLVLGGGRAALAVVRAIPRKRFRVVLGIPPGGNLAAASAHAEASWRHPPLQATKDFRHGLARWCRQQSPPYYLFPATEIANDCLTQGRTEIPAEALIVAPSGEVIETCRDKESFYQLAERIGLPIPRTRVTHTPQELLNHANDLGYPCLIKPARFAFQALGWKATVCTGPEMVQQFANTWPTSVEAMLVQQLLRGWRYNCQFVARQGDLLTYFEHLVIRTDRFDGTGLVVESSSVAPTPEHFHATRALARELRYTGPGCLQVLRDPASDTWGVLELNPRLAATCGFPLACGVNLMALAIDAVDPASRTANPLRDLSDVTYRPGVRLDWLGGDLRGLFRSVRAHEITFTQGLLWAARLLRALLRADRHLVWSLRDPLPAIKGYFTEQRRAR